MKHCLLFTTSKNRISSKYRLECVTSTKNTFSSPQCRYERNFLRRFRICCQKSVAQRNLELRSKTGFSLLGPQEVFLSVGEADKSKLTSKTKSLYAKVLENKVSGHSGLVARRNRGKCTIFARKSKIQPPSISAKICTCMVLGSPSAFKRAQMQSGMYVHHK